MILFGFLDDAWSTFNGGLDLQIVLGFFFFLFSKELSDNILAESLCPTQQHSIKHGEVVLQTSKAKRCSTIKWQAYKISVSWGT